MFQVVLRSEMPNKKETIEHRGEFRNGDHDGYTALPLSPFRLTDFEFECKTEPDSAGEGLSEFDTTPTNLEDMSHIPMPTIKNPIVLLERCDKIWETLQLIRTQDTELTASEDEDKDEEEKGKGENRHEDRKIESFFKKTEQICPSKPLKTLPIKSLRKLTNDSKTPFQFSVQRTRKLFPCIVCGKQYLEKRSLRKHALNIHGIIIPVKHRRPRKPDITDIQDSNTLHNKGNSNSDKCYNNKYSHRKMTTGKTKAMKFPSILTHLKRSENVSNVDSINVQSEKTKTKPVISIKSQYNRCVLCQQKVKCVKKHLINYHKIGCSANMLKQLETSLVVEATVSSDSKKSMLKEILSGSKKPMLKDILSGSKKPMLKDILSGKPSETSITKGMQNKYHMVRNKDKIHESSQVPQKRKYTSPYATAKKRFRLSNGRYASPQDIEEHMQKKYKCDICLGVYSSTHTFNKHRRIHASRGETKENFHKFKCNYFNSPLSKRYQQLMGVTKSTNTVPGNVNNGLSSDSRNVQSNDSKTSSPNQRTSRISRTADANKEDTTCSCGRSFRNLSILRMHKDNCKIHKQEEKRTQHNTRDGYSSDRDSGIGINITIKKRNNSYEIVGKDGEEDKQINVRDDDTPLSNGVSHNVVENAATADTVQQLDKSETSKYSKTHSVLKIRDADEDLIIDIEEDSQQSNKKRKQTVTQENDTQENGISLKTEQQDVDEGVAKEDNTVENIRSLKQMCQEVIKKISTLQESDDTACPRKRRNVQSVSKSCEKTETEEKQQDGLEPSAAVFDLTTCSYCNKRFGTISLYNKHRCTVEEGKTYDDYSLNLLCFCCGATLNSCSQFDEHMKTVHYDRAFHCYLCPEKFPDKKIRNKHTNTQHDTSCRFCHMDIPLWIINLHEAYHLGFGYPCHKCKKAYSSKRNLIYHNSTIHKKGVDTMVFCNLCLKSIKLKSFRSHMHSHDSNKCYFCKKEFNDKAGTEYHTLIYHGGAFSKLKCNDCNTRFLTKRQLEQHRKIGKCGNVKRIKKENTESCEEYC
ncbi:uncharacterized protein LOC105189047 isoform X1 [Harpegnathos saltator]|uniref:uncharacterized protein LOC105189047 isoform X1 n=1 Tax=Harpegnathos saltator TaxID=610380 RepID=UPI0005907608|nr:uncharacterized protein LOC105189047 isoform X1 [Harpegnathos saltator]